MIAEVIGKLDDTRGETGLHLVEGAAQFQAIVESQKNPTATPAAFVLPMRELPGDRPFSGSDIQKFDIAVAVVLVVRNVADVKGAAALDALQALRDAVKLALLGWVPLTGYASLARGQGNLLAFKDGHLWWQDTYTSSFYERKS